MSRLSPSCVLFACAAMVTAQTFTLVHVFNGSDGAEPAGALVPDTNGNLYGVTGFGGTTGFGTLFKIIKKNNKEAVLHSFSQSTDGENPDSLLRGADGNLYGLTSGAGPNGWGTAFRSSTAGAFSVVYSFVGGAKAAIPSVLLAGSNALYGAANGGGAPFYGGSVFRLDTTGETDLYTFASGADGSGPSTLVRDNAGNLYGGAHGGDLTCNAPYGCGVLFKVDVKGFYTVLHVFVGPDGSTPTGLTLGQDGNLYGTTYSGGPSDSGTVFEMTPAGQVTTLYSFTGGADGQYPLAGVIRDPAGNLYGTTYGGGVASSQCYNAPCGVIFVLAPTSSGAWKETVLHAFNGSDGESPDAPLTLDLSQPALYGTTDRGGNYNCTTLNGGNSCGVVFKITK